VRPDGTPIEDRVAHRPGEDPATAEAEERAVEDLLAKRGQRTARPGSVPPAPPARKRGPPRVRPPRNEAVSQRRSKRHRKR
jgi:hypothetical protein